MRNSGTTIAILLALGTLGIPGSAFAQRGADRLPELRVAQALTEQTVTGEVLAVNRAARTLTVRSVVGGKVIDSIFSVYESAALTLTALEPGDVVRITYVTRGDQPQARRLVKVTAADRSR